MDFSRRSYNSTCSLWTYPLLIWLCLASYQDLITAIQVSAMYSQYICPEGHSVNLTCTITGQLIDKHDHIVPIWHFSKDKDSNCQDAKHVRNMTKHHVGHSQHNINNGIIHLTLHNLSHGDSGGYCCYVLETSKKHVRQKSHGYIELQVKSGDKDLQTCSQHSAVEEKNDNTTAAALAIISCIIGILCLPLILVLVYKQRKAISHRRAQELVRMDSEAQGIENPVFDDPPAINFEQRPRLAFMASRQQSDSGRHLLSEPSTPLSPPGTDTFFPSLEPVSDLPESPDPLKN
ncbi:V-type immunoglobulin domain-containing suppressor of T-cell activation [Bombina bombina]|uniref:V-type immunoglobulin domain-containing suppressor of T-cell activation n=1 Tax=Bombina bombina TaxID=8345 RepID=UPI00235AAD9B|nr:V-type immunoglobulin domain-containing suppressor of T-cell activation [Bombina bombina]